jgi:hypothetical protein
MSRTIGRREMDSTKNGKVAMHLTLITGAADRIGRGLRNTLRAPVQCCDFRTGWYSLVGARLRRRDSRHQSARPITKPAP